MKALLVVSLGCLLAGGVYAQRGGGGGARGGGGFGGGGFRGGAGMGGGFRGGGGFGGSRGWGGGSWGGSRGGSWGGSWRGGSWGRGWGWRGGWGRGWGGWGWGWPGWGWGWNASFWPGWGWGWGGGIWPGWSDASWDSSMAYAPSYGYGASAAPSSTVVFPPQQSAPSVTNVYVQQPVHSTTHTYDQYGQEIPSGGPSGGNSGYSGGNSGYSGTSSPLYLLAFTDHQIRAAISYRLEGNELVYVTPQHEEKRAPLSSVDRGLSQELNRQRHVPFTLP